MGKEKSKTKSTILKIVGVVFLVIIIALIAVALRYLTSFNDFLDKITKGNPEVKEYGVLVKNDSELSDVVGLKNKSVGFLKTDATAGRAEKHLNNIVEIKADFYDDIDTLIGALNNDITNAAVMETDRIEALKEEEHTDIKDMRIIYTFEVELEKENTEISYKEITKEPFIVYISGSDSRNGIKAVARSDVNIVAIVNPEQGKILLVSIPRDTYVQLHGTTGLKDKLTHAGIYGIDMSKTTIEDLLGIDIDYTIKVSFDTVVKVVDEIDGIDITSDTEMNLSSNGERCHYVVGTQHVNGNCALRFARERKTYSTGDRHRGENQQQIITGIINKLISSKSYLFKIPTILDIAADSFETTISRDDVAEFIRLQLTNQINWKVESIAVDGSSSMQPTYSMGANLPLYVMFPNEESLTNATNKINEYLK